MSQIDLSKIELEPILSHTSKGNQPKWQLNGKWYKADHMGYESLAEVLVSRLLIRSNIKEFVQYEPLQIQYNNKSYVGCVSDNFKKKEEMLIPLERLHRVYSGKGFAEALSKINDTKEKILYTVNFIEDKANLKDIGKYITVLTELDAFFLNEDRHTNNIAVIRDENTKLFKTAPIFDNGLSLLSDINDYSINDNIYDCIDKVKAKPFDIDFDVQMDAAEDLYGQQLKFDFNKSDVHSIIEEFKEFYDPQIIKRVEKVLLEQMRKYTIFF